MADFVEVCSAFDRKISESKTETIPRAPAAHIVFNATLQHITARQPSSPNYLGGAVIEPPNLSAEIDRWIHAGWMSFSRRYTWDLRDRPKEVYRT